MRKEPVYAYYSRGKYVMTGTKKEIAEATGVKLITIHTYAAPSAEKKSTKRLVLLDKPVYYEADEVNSEKIRELQAEFDYSVEDIAELIDKAPDTYAKKLNGERRFEKSELEEIADLFFVDLEELMI